MRILFILLLLVSPFCFSKEPPLVIGIISFYPPFDMKSDQTGHFSGFEADLMNAICKVIKRECEFKGMPFVDFMARLNNGKIDLAIGAISITPKREKEFLFSLPYLPSSVVFVARANSKYSASKSIKGTTVGMLTGNETATLIEADKVDSFKIKTYNYVSNMMQALENKKIDLVLTDAMSAEHWVSENQNIFKLVGKRVTSGNGYGIMTLKKKHALMDKINRAILKLEKDGIYLKIYSEYFQPKF